MEEKDHKDFRKRLIMDTEWIDGKSTASGKTKEIKKNLQLDGNSELYKILSEEIIKIINNTQAIKNFVFPKKIFNLLFSRTGVGMYYGPHIDVPNVSGGRRDFSFTIFLNDPDKYTGGELILNIPPETKRIKLKAGEIIIYPTRYLHEVREVTQGERMVCVGWIESEIAREDDRECLIYLKKGINEVAGLTGDKYSALSLNIAFNNIYKRFMS